MGPLSGRWRQSGNDQQCLAAPIWKYRSGFSDHRFTFFIDLRPNYTFYTNLTNIVHWVVAYRDVAHLIRLNLGKSWEKPAKSFDAGLSIDTKRDSNHLAPKMITLTWMRILSIVFLFFASSMTISQCGLPSWTPVHARDAGLPDHLSPEPHSDHNKTDGRQL